MSHPKVFLGPKNLLPSGVVVSDVDVWRALDSKLDLIVDAGGRHAQWVKNIAHSRQWEIVPVEDPRVRVAREYPELAPYLGVLLPNDAPPPPVLLWEWASQELAGLPYSPVPSTEHAERLGRWRLTTSLSSAQQTLLRVAVEQFSAAFEYGVASHTSTDEILSHVVGDVETPYTHEWDPEDEPSVVSQVAAWARKRHAAEGIEGVRSALLSKASLASKRIMARTLAKVGKPSIELASLLQPFVTYEDLERLIAGIQPDLPTSIPSDPAALPDWFERTYLPYRRWMHAQNVASDERSEAVWSTFADLYLKAYRTALGSGKGNLAMLRSRTLRQNATRSLMVVLDGPLPDDTDRLLRRLREKAPAWAIVSRAWTLAAVPTITEIGRPSVVSGLSAMNLSGSDDAITSIDKARAPLESGAHFVVIKLDQPDKAYHAVGESPANLQRAAGHKIADIADDLVGLLSLVDEIVITADHGRCLGSAAPTIEPPEGDVHGRAAMRVSRDGAAEPEGSRRLPGDLLGFSAHEDAVVALGSRTFLGAKHIWYSHGGLLPEEAFVPWAVLRKASHKVELGGEVHLTGTLDRGGEILVQIQNYSEVEVRPLWIEWESEGNLVKVLLDADFVAPASTENISTAISKVEDSYPGEIHLVASTPDGINTKALLPLNSSVRRMQTQNIDLLDDL